MNMDKNLVQHKRTKHIDVRNHFHRDNIDKKNVVMSTARCRFKWLIFHQGIGQRKIHQEQIEFQNAQDYLMSQEVCMKSLI